MSTISPYDASKLLTVTNYNQSQNTSMQNQYSQPEIFGLLPSLVVISFWTIIGVTANMFVCWAILRKKELRTPTFYLMINMAISDCLILCISTIILAINYYLSTRLFYTQLMVIVCKIIFFIDAIGYISSIFTLVVLSIERYYSISSSNLSSISFFNTNFKLGSVIAFSWIVGVLIAWPHGIIINILPHRPLMCNFAFIRPSFNIPYYICMSILIFAIPSTIIIVMYSKIIRFLYRNIQHNNKHRQNNEAFQSSRRRQLNTIKMLSIVTFAFMVSCLPVFITYLALSFRHQNSLEIFIQTDGFQATLALLSFISHTVPCVLNPFIYLYYNQTIRAALPIRCYRRYNNFTIQISPANTSNQFLPP
ncbi:Substance-K receptor [Trichoplax sp. H2]|nr:Substance-K receptor [Trichoplax sp. H2]|eukprot:RDD37891.1 Substance-K receptor [Trichoplax sp. H2]